ncbi:MAG: S-methyl-5'-thioadenosine phosphorylase [Syntrophomonadaceae bacterium]|nr:S-methyl-5'-thioadenosine phosphorylase [Syntrophomonadaceae bacterium]
MSAIIAIIGGTGVYDPAILSDLREEKVKTPYGEVQVQLGKYEGQEVAFVPRHGEKHSVPPHRINYRANIWSLQELGVQRAIATAAVGSLNSDMKPKDLVMIDQFLDFTRGREQSFYEGGEEGVFHLDVTFPYCRELRQALFQSAKRQGLNAHFHGTYVCTEGPRFETTAEIRMYRQLGGDVVGMTSVPEVVLARELGICYATIAMVTNYAAGISPNPLTHSEVVEVMAQNVTNLRKVIMGALKELKPERCNDCAAILKEAPVRVGRRD